MSCQKGLIDEFKVSKEQLSNMVNDLMNKFSGGKKTIQNISGMLKSLKLNDQYSVNDFKTIFDRHHDGKISKGDLSMFCQIWIKADYLFKYYNKGNNQEIEGADLDYFLTKMRCQTKEEKDKLMKIIDTDGNKKLSQSEFYHVCKVKVIVDFIFEKYAKNNKLTLAIIFTILKKLKLPDTTNLPKFEQCDADGSTFLDKVETFNYVSLYFQNHKNWVRPNIPRPPKKP